MKLCHRAVNRLLPMLAVALISLQSGAATFYQGVTPATVPWPGGIVPYQFGPEVTSTQQVVYLDGMREWELAANVKFVPYTNQSNYVILHFYFQKGTNTYVASSPAVMTIDTLRRSQIGHETGHLLGFQHEHVRTNRDSYITVNFANLQSGVPGEGPGSGGISNLYVIDTNSTSFGAYDFESVMHYGRRLFAANPDEDVIDPLPAYVSHYYNRIGNLCISPLDRAGAAYLYGAPTTPLTNIVTTTADVGLGSLRAAIYYANDHPGTTIRFNIPNTDPGLSNGVYTIYLTGELPPLVTNGTVIDATTQPGFTGKPIVAIDGSHLIPEALDASGIHFYESLCTIRGLAIGSVPDSPVQMLYNFCMSNHVEGCYIGLAPNGSNAAPSVFEGINVAGGAHYNVIGGTSASQRNVISGNTNYGITVTETNSDNNIIEGNYIGLDATGTFAVTNLKSGIGIFNGPHNTVVGGTNAGAGNVLSGNTEYGIFIGDPITVGTVVQGNYIGTDATGSNAVANRFGGIGVFNGANNVTIGGTTTGARNVVSGNVNAGIWLADPGTTNNVVQGNFIGLNASGSNAVPNTFVGIYVLNNACSNLIGGTNAGAGNVVSGNFSENIYIAEPGTSNNYLLGNRIGTDVSGTHGFPGNFTGVGIWATANNNVVGGTNAGAGNLISGNGGNGVTIGDTNTTGNVVQGNLIGTTTNGMAALANGGHGVYIRDGASNNLVGGNASAARNILSGNSGDGVCLENGATANLVIGNYIGVNTNGTAALSNSFSGVVMDGGSSGNIIGTPDPATRNIISGNSEAGVFITDSGTMSNLVQGNYIGTAVGGLAAISNLTEGVVIINGASDNLIGGTAAGAGNVIAANQNRGVFMGNTGTMGNVLQGNYVGVGADGHTRLGNGLEGIVMLNGASSNLVGGTVAGARNVSSGNGTRGVWISDAGTAGNLVQGNYVGVAADGVTAVSNVLEGVIILQGAQANVVGLDIHGAGAGNVIANNGLEGVAIYDPTTSSNTIRGNAISNNGKLGINLVGGTEDSFGVTANDLKDPDTGPNNLQNFPVISAASVASGMTGIAGSLNSTPSRTFLVDVYRNSAADPSGHGEGQVYLGTASTTTDANGNGNFLVIGNGNFTGQAVATTATDTTTGDTSEFGTSVVATNGPALLALTGPFTRNNSGFAFNLTLQTNLSYHILASTNLSISNSWVSLTNFTATTSPVPFIDSGATNLPLRFYRAVTP